MKDGYLYNVYRYIKYIGMTLVWPRAIHYVIYGANSLHFPPRLLAICLNISGSNNSVFNENI
jgi:hypothetical protein